MIQKNTQQTQSNSNKFPSFQISFSWKGTRFWRRISPKWLFRGSNSWCYGESDYGTCRYKACHVLCLNASIRRNIFLCDNYNMEHILIRKDIEDFSRQTLIELPSLFLSLLIIFKAGGSHFDLLNIIYIFYDW